MSFQTACLVLCLRGSRPGKTQYFPAFFFRSCRSAAGRLTRRRFPVFFSTIQNCGFNCSGRSSKTSEIRSPVCKLTRNASRFSGMSSARTWSTSFCKRYSVLIFSPPSWVFLWPSFGAPGRAPARRGLAFRAHLTIRLL